MKTFEITADYEHLFIGMYKNRATRGFIPSAATMLDAGFKIGSEIFTAGLLPLSEPNPEGFSDAEDRHLFAFLKQNIADLDKDLKIAAIGTWFYIGSDSCCSPYIYFDNKNENIWSSWYACFSCCFDKRVKENYYKLVIKMLPSGEE